MVCPAGGESTERDSLVGPPAVVDDGVGEVESLDGIEDVEFLIQCQSVKVENSAKYSWGTPCRARWKCPSLLASPNGTG